MAIDRDFEAASDAAAANRPMRKLRFDLIPAHGLTAVAEAMTIGEDKRPGDGQQWRGKPVAHHMAALLRHVYAIQRGELRDPDGQWHAASVAARALMISELHALAERPTT